MLTALMLSLVLQAAVGSPAGQPPAFARADAPREWDLPADHRAHPEYALEWWYLTGDLRSESGERFGYQATFFRTALAPPGAVERESPLAARELILWHGSITDVGEQRFLADAEIGRAAAGWAEASAETLNVRVGAHSLSARSADKWELRASVGDWRIELDFSLDRAPVLNGASPGWSRKGAERGNSSYYVSRVQMPTTGRLAAPDGSVKQVSGRSWFDQEFGSGQLEEGQAGWDWFSLNLSDGSALMLYQLRDDAGTPSPSSSGSWVRPDGSSRHVAKGEFEIRVRETWTSPASGATYPIAWELVVPGEQLRLQLRPVMRGQERGGGEGEGGVVYWEGLVDAEGNRAGRPIEGSGYVELVGYASPFKLMR
jgi:predicted secreted hydrolase